MSVGMFLGSLVLGWLLLGLCSAVGPPHQVGPYQSRQIAKVGQPKKKFLCPVEAEPAPFIQWFKDGESVTEIWERYRIVKEGSLRIKDIELEDAGKYVCKATNGFGVIFVNYSLIVIDKDSGLVNQGESSLPPDAEEDSSHEGGKIRTKPTLIGPHPLNESVSIGETATFRCKVKSIVRPHIQWLKRMDKESELDSNETATIEVKSQKFMVLKTQDVWMDSEGFYVNKLVIKNVLPVDVGMYICLGANQMGYSFRSAFLTIEDGENSDGILGQGNQGNTIGSGYNLGTGSGRATDSQSESSDSSSNAGNSLPLIIAIPACVAIVLVTLAIFILQRRRRCNAHSNTHRTTRFNAVPTHERETYPTPVHSNPNMIPPLGPPSSRAASDKMSKLHNADFYSDISSVSRCHHQQSQLPQQHSNINHYGGY